MFLRVDLLDNTTKATKWTICNLYCFINCVRNIKIFLKLSFFCSAQHTIYIRLWYRSWFIQTSKETQNIREEAQRMRNITLQFGFYKDITWKRNFFFNDSLTITNSSMLLNWYKHLRNISCK